MFGIVMVAMIVTALELLTAVGRYPTTVEIGTINDSPIGWSITAFPEALLGSGIGVLALIGVLYLVNGIGHVFGLLAQALLGRTDGPT